MGGAGAERRRSPALEFRAGDSADWRRTAQITGHEAKRAIQEPRLAGVHVNRKGGWVVYPIGWAIALGSCAPSSGAPGTACHSPGDCQTGLACLYPIGAGCGQPGACDVPPNGCLPNVSDLILCGCLDAQPDLSCIGNNATLSQPTATGSACGGGADAADPDANAEQ